MGAGRSDEEFAKFFAAESERLERFAAVLVADPLHGAELAQEALARVYARWGRIREGSPRGYARQIVVNLVRSEHRSKQLRSLKPVPAWAGGAEAAADSPQERLGDSMRVLEALDRLPPLRRAAVLLRFFEDMSEGDIARVLERPVGTVKSDIHRALRQLRPLLDEVDTGGRRR